MSKMNSVVEDTIDTDKNSDIQSSKPYWTGYRKFIVQSRILLVMMAVGFSAVVVFAIPNLTTKKRVIESYDNSGIFNVSANTNMPTIKVLSDYTYYMNHPEFFVYDENDIIKSVVVMGIHVKVDHPMQFVCYLDSNIDSIDSIKPITEKIDKTKVVSLSKDYSYYIDNPIVNIVNDKGNIRTLKVEGIYVKIDHPVKILCKVSDNKIGYNH